MKSKSKKKLKFKSLNDFPVDDIYKYLDSSLANFLGKNKMLTNKTVEEAENEKAQYCLLVALAVKDYFDNKWKDDVTPNSDVLLGTVGWTGYRPDGSGTSELKNVRFKNFDLATQNYHAWNLLPFKEGLYLMDFNVPHYFVESPFNAVLKKKVGKDIKSYKKVFQSEGLNLENNGFFKYTVKDDYEKCKDSLDDDLIKNIVEFKKVFKGSNAFI